MVIDKDWKNFKCEDCGRDIKTAGYKYIFLGYFKGSDNHKKVCVPCFEKNKEYGDLYRQIVKIEFDSNPPHSVIKEENIKQYSVSNQELPEKKPETANSNKGISKGEWFLIGGIILVVSLILVGLFYYWKKNKQK